MAGQRQRARALLVGLVMLGAAIIAPAGPAAAVPPEYEVLTSVTLPSQPADVAVDPARGVLYVSFTTENVVRVLDESTLEILTEIPVSTLPAVPRELAVDPVSGMVLASISPISSITAGEVAVIDPDTRAVVATIPVGDNPLGITISAVSRTAYVANSSSTTPVLTVLDLTTPSAPTVRGTISLPSGAERVTESADGSVLYVTGSSTNAIWVVDATTGDLLDTWTGFSNPHQVTLSSDGVSGFLSIQLSTAEIRDLTSGAVTGNIPVANSYYQSVDRDRDTVLMTAPFLDGGSVLVLDATTGEVTQTLAVTSAHHIATDTTRGLSFVTSINASGVLTVIHLVSPSAPLVTQDPADVTVQAGADATFTAAATGDAVTVQWQRSDDGGTTWIDVPGATSTSLTVGSTTTADSGALVRAVFSNDGGTATTAPAELTVTAAPLPALTVTSTVLPEEISVGGTATVQVTVRNAGPGAATGVLVQTDLGDLLRLDDAQPATGTFGTATGTWNIGALAAGASTTLTLQVTGTTAGTAVPRFTLTSDVLDPAATPTTVTLVITAPEPEPTPEPSPSAPAPAPAQSVGTGTLPTTGAAPAGPAGWAALLLISGLLLLTGVTVARRRRQDPAARP